MEPSADEGARAARRLVADLQIESVLDAGPGAGELAGGFGDLDIDASSLDTTDAAAVELLDRKYDLVVCIDALEQLPPADAERALENLCAATDRVLFSSKPFDYSEPSRVNVHAPEDWSAQFARQGFVRNLDYDATYLAPWAALYERSHTLLPEVVRAYDRAWWQLRLEVRQLREKVLELHAQIEEGAAPVAAENLRLREELLLARDDLVGHEARLGEALGRIELLQSELRHQDALADADRILGSRTGRLLRAWHRLRALLR
jgi:hypothetical protein